MDTMKKQTLVALLNELIAERGLEVTLPPDTSVLFGDMQDDVLELVVTNQALEEKHEAIEDLNDLIDSQKMAVFLGPETRNHISQGADGQTALVLSGNDFLFASYIGEHLVFATRGIEDKPEHLVPLDADNFSYKESVVKRVNALIADHEFAMWIPPDMRERIATFRPGGCVVLSGGAFREADMNGPVIVQVTLAPDLGAPELEDSCPDCGTPLCPECGEHLTDPEPYVGHLFPEHIDPKDLN